MSVMIPHRHHNVLARPVLTLITSPWILIISAVNADYNVISYKKSLKKVWRELWNIGLAKQ
jgi:hypothetical protein